MAVSLYASLPRHQRCLLLHYAGKMHFDVLMMCSVTRSERRPTQHFDSVDPTLTPHRRVFAYYDQRIGKGWFLASLSACIAEV